MPVSAKSWPASVVLAALLSFPSVPASAQGGADKDSVRECARAYENSQEHRRAGELSAARSEFARCRQDDCPEFIHDDCSRWSKEAEAAQPSVLFSAKRDNRDVRDVRVSTDERVLAEQLQGQAVELDPGGYDLRFETPGSDAVVRHVMLQVGDKNHLVEVEFAPLIPAAPSAVTAHSKRSPDSAPAQSGSQLLPWTLLAVGATSIGTGVGFALSGRNRENSLHDSCSPNCSDAQVRPVHTKYLLSDLSFGVGLLSVSLAAYLFVSNRAADPAARATMPLTVTAVPNGVLAGYGARF